MVLLRSLIFFLLLLLSTILIASFVTLFGWLFPGDRIYIFDTAWSRFNLKMLALLCDLDYTVTGLENLPEESCVILAKHQSAWETIALISIINRPKAWVIKRELLFVPFFGWVMWYYKPIAINRKAGRKAVDQVIEQGLERLRAGRDIIMFPEGTRVAPNTRKRYGIGGALLAERAKCQVVPIAHNAGVFWRRRGIKKYPGTIEVRIGPAIDTKQLSASQIKQRVEEWIEQQQQEMPLKRPDK